MGEREEDLRGAIRDACGRAKQCNRFAEVPALSLEHAEQVKEFRIARGAGEELTIDRLSLSQSAGAVVVDRELDRILHPAANIPAPVACDRITPCSAKR